MRINSKSIRFRLIAWYVLSLGVVHFLVAMGLYQTVSARLHHELDERLNTYATCLVDLLPRDRPSRLAEIGSERAALIALGPDLYVRVVDGTQQVIFESTRSPAAVADTLRSAFAMPPNLPLSLQVAGSGTWRMLRREVSEEGKLLYVGVVGVPLREVQQTLTQFQFVLIAIVPGVLILASFGAWLVLNRALRPLREMIRTARAIQAQELDLRLRVPETDDEMQGLAETFNEMVGRLHRSFAQMRQFITDASHELRSPLAVLRGEVELGLKARLDANRCQEILGLCAVEIARLSGLVETLLFLSNADAEKAALDFKPVNLTRVMDEMAEQTRILAEAKGVEVTLVNGHGIVMPADEMRVRQLLLNLVGNAVKFTPPGGRITLSCRSVDGQAEFVVRDTGIGIEPKHLPHVFDRFYRADRSDPGAGGGYGLGLSICRWIVEAHRGTIQVESVPGKGSAFTVRLPLADEKLSQTSGTLHLGSLG
ncbi:MAG: ATP-binding protein [Opitutaceae bacterium]|nr:ATP-binding protein [Opitutaceae bacterium]